MQAAIEARDVPAVARLVIAGSSTRVRQAAAHAIDDPDLLRQLIREVRGGNDKHVYKVLTSKRDALLEQARRLEQAQAEISAVAQAIERHSRLPYDAIYAPQLDQFESDWKAVTAKAAPRDPELCGRVAQWVARSRETIAGHSRQVAEQAALAQAAAEAAAEARRLADEQAQAAAGQARLLEEQERARAEKQQAEQQALREIGEMVRKARGALSGGGTFRAASVRRTIEDRLAGAPPLPAGLAAQLQQLDQQLAELKDWKSFSVAPKRAELIEAMESLIDAPFDPPALAEKIKNLQEEWRALGKGAAESAQAEADADWQRFQEAGKKAYQPCSEYFAAQALVRQENLQRRDAVLARLMAFEAEQNWESPDWRSVINTLREAKQEWRRHAPVDRRAAKSQEDRFGAVTASLQDRLDAEYARNVKQKEVLIERAGQLLAGDDSRKAIDEVKRLQQKWQAVGPVPREMDQRLWAAFRQQCDAVFNKRQQDSAAHAAGLEHNKVQAIALCEQIEQIALLEGAELVARSGTLAELRKAFESLGEFPRADTRELHHRLERALDRCAKALARQRARDAERAWDDLFEAANHVRAYRLAFARGREEEAASLKQAAENFMAPIARWPNGGLDALRQALVSECSGDLEANERALKMVCIRAELLADLPTPAEDQPLRREYQLQRLVQTMGQGVKADAAQLDTLALEWVAAGPVEEAIHAPLLQRFRRCREHGDSRTR
ncbi:MAG TPA: DUF349 domain-containing protein [Nevskiaceae bacterium]|nr:DUF349 domain-containing protein [Nevskiaceae bacterium]